MASKGNCIRVAVTWADESMKSRTVNCDGQLIRFNVLPEISSILDTPSDLVLHVVDAMRLEDTLYPVTKLNDMDIKVIIALHNYEQYKATGHTLDIKQLSRMLGMPAVVSDADDPLGGMELIGKIAEAARQPFERKVSVPYGQDVEKAISRIAAAFHEGHEPWLHFSERYIAVRLLEHQDYIMPYVESLPNAGEVLAVARKEHDRLERDFGKPSELLVAQARRGFVVGALHETVKHGGDSSDHSFAMKLDANR